VGVVAIEATDETIFSWIDDAAPRRIALKISRVGLVDVQCEIITPALAAVVVGGACALAELVPA
jgi:hypothetical protein